MTPSKGRGVHIIILQLLKLFLHSPKTIIVEAYHVAKDAPRASAHPIPAILTRWQ